MNTNPNSNNSIRKKRLHFCMRMLSQQLPASIVVALSMGFSDMADSLVLGNRIGEIGLAAIALSAPVYMVMNIIIQGFGPGGSIRYSTLMAAGKEEEARTIYFTCIKYSIIGGLIIAAIVNSFMPAVLWIQGTTRAASELYAAASTYLRIVSAGAPIIIVSFVINDFMRNEDLEKAASFGASVGNVLDIGLNIFLVLFLHMGITGSAIATVTGKTVSLIIYVVLIIVKKSRLSTFFGRTQIGIVPACFKTGASTAIQYVSDLIFFLMVNNVLMRMAGQSGIAIFDLIQNVSYLLMYLCLSFAEAGQPAISTYTGEKNIEARDFLKGRIILLGEICVFVLTIVLFINSKYICLLFGVTDYETIALGVRSIRLYLLGAPAMCAALILGSFYQSCDNTRASYLIATLRGIVILLPTTFAMSFSTIDYFFLLYPLTEYISIFIFFICSNVMQFDKIEYDEERICRYLIENDVTQLSSCCEKVEAFCEKWDVNPKQRYLAQMALEELVGAIMQYGFKDADGLCEVTLVVSDDMTITLHIRDNAILFNPFDIKRKNSGIDEDEIDLLCIDVIKSKSKSFFYRRYNGFNTLVINM